MENFPTGNGKSSKTSWEHTGNELSQTRKFQKHYSESRTETVTKVPTIPIKMNWAIVDIVHISNKTGGITSSTTQREYASTHNVFFSAQQFDILHHARFVASIMWAKLKIPRCTTTPSPLHQHQEQPRPIVNTRETAIQPSYVQLKSDYSISGDYSIQVDITGYR